MKAITYKKFGLPTKVFELRDVDKPLCAEDEVLVKVHAASIQFADWAFARGKPFIVRLMGAGLFNPKNPILGSDFAGYIEAIGNNVKKFQPGDEVFGDLSVCGYGGFAEYVSVPEDALVLKPANLTFGEAAAVPQAAVVALQGLRDKGKIQSGQKVLVNGASGGIGSFAIQIAKTFEAEVTGICSTSNINMVKSIGADFVIDYANCDFTKEENRYDLIFDMVVNHSVSDYLRVLTPEGIYVAGAMSWSAAFLGPFLTIRGKKKVGSLAANSNVEDLKFLAELITEGKVKPVIDSCYRLNQVAEALEHYGNRHAKGKVVITIVPEEGE